MSTIEFAVTRQMLNDLEKEASLYAVTLANVSAALLGILTPGMPYEGNKTSVAEAMQVRRALFILARDLQLAKARGLYDVEAADCDEEIQRAVLAAKGEIQIIYDSQATVPAPFRQGKEPS